MEKTFENWLVVSDIDGTLNNKSDVCRKETTKQLKNLHSAAETLLSHQAELLRVLKEIIIV